MRTFEETAGPFYRESSVPEESRVLGILSSDGDIVYSSHIFVGGDPKNGIIAGIKSVATTLVEAGYSSMAIVDWLMQEDFIGHTETRITQLSTQGIDSVVKLAESEVKRLRDGSYT